MPRRRSPVVLAAVTLVATSGLLGASAGRIGLTTATLSTAHGSVSVPDDVLVCDTFDGTGTMAGRRVTGPGCGSQTWVVGYGSGGQTANGVATPTPVAPGWLTAAIDVGVPRMMVATTLTISTTENGGVVLNASPPGSKAYGIGVIVQRVNSTGSMQIWGMRGLAQSVTFNVDIPVAAPPTGPWTVAVRAQFVGGVLTAWVNGALVVTWTAPAWFTPLPGTYAGIWGGAGVPFQDFLVRPV